MALSPMTNDRRFGKGSSPSGLHYALVIFHLVMALSLVAFKDSRRPEPTPQFNDMASFISSRQAARDQHSRHPVLAASVPLRFTLPRMPQMNIARLQQELHKNTGVRLHEDSAGPVAYTGQIQLYPLQPLQLKVAGDVPAEKTDVTLKLVPPQFSWPPLK